MAARAIWSGTLKLGSINLPVKLYSAVQDRSVRFHILEAKTKIRVKQHMVNAETGEDVPNKEIRRGYELDRGRFVLLDRDELAKLEPKASRDIEVTRFVPLGHISHLWYDRPYYLGPNGNNNDYFAFVHALQKENREGIARWVMRKKSYAGALRPTGDFLALIALKPAEDILSERELPDSHARGLTGKELKMAEELVRAMEGELRLEEFRDEYRGRLLEFVKAKSKGKRPRLHAAREKPATMSLADDLAKSLASLKHSSRKREKEPQVA
jgi:DNA end-binding protein Ku